MADSMHPRPDEVRPNQDRSNVHTAVILSDDEWQSDLLLPDFPLGSPIASDRLPHPLVPVSPHHVFVARRPSPDSSRLKSSPDIGGARLSSAPALRQAKALAFESAASAPCHSIRQQLPAHHHANAFKRQPVLHRGHFGVADRLRRSLTCPSPRARRSSRLERVCFDTRPTCTQNCCPPIPSPEAQNRARIAI
jgi:hypothetical protein